MLIGVSAVSAAVAGYRVGFIARATSWAGLALGLYAGVRFLPDVLREVSDRDPTVRLLIAAGVLIGSAVLGQVIGLLVGNQLRRVVAPGPIGVLDHGVGAATGLLGVLVSVWLLLPSMAQVQGWPARQAANSGVARAIDRLAPPPPNALDTVRQLVGDQAFPRVFESLRPAPETGPPPAAAGLSPELQARVAVSTVKVESVACRRLQQGSGWAAGPDLIVTNAHVVAGQSSTTVMRTDRRKLRAEIVAFDPDRDLAVLRVPGLGREPLPMGDASVGTTGAVFGHPEGQDALAIAPAGIRQQVSAVGRDLYNEHSTRREVFILAARLHQGDSGGALVNGQGQVVGVAFAIAPDEPETAYALTSDEVRAVLPTARGRVSAGRCLHG